MEGTPPSNSDPKDVTPKSARTNLLCPQGTRTNSTCSSDEADHNVEYHFDEDASIEMRVLFEYGDASRNHSLARALSAPDLLVATRGPLPGASVLVDESGEARLNKAGSRSAPDLRGDSEEYGVLPEDGSEELNASAC